MSRERSVVVLLSFYSSHEMFALLILNQSIFDSLESL